MLQINIKSEQAVKLLEQAVQVTGQGKTQTVIQALEYYLKSLEANKRAEAAIKLVEEQLHPLIPAEQRGSAPSKEEQEALLGF